jgi:predicted  nucleic acid-binding Zn-ribbon protein
LACPYYRFEEARKGVSDMGKMISWKPDPENMEEADLQSYLQQLRQRIAALDEREPEDMDSEEYDAWAQEHEALEDDIDDVLDALERFQG